MKVLTYQHGDELRVVIPNYQAGYTVESIRAANPPEAVEVDSDALPSRVLRNSWKLENGAVTIDLPKAKEIAHEIRRAKRDEYMKANLELISKDAMGIPLKSGESAAQAKQDNAQYKSTVDDVMQLAIDNATNESEILSAIGIA